MPSLVIMILIRMITLLIFRTTRRWALLVSLLVVLGACSTPDADDGRPLVVATTSIWGDVVGEIVGGDAVVEVLIPQGSDSHDYEPTPRQIAQLVRADLVVANGLGLEAGLGDALATAVGEGANLLEVAPLVDPLPFSDHGHEDHETDDAGDHDDLDPHVWLDPTRVAKAVGHIADELSLVDDSADWAARAGAYSADLLALDEEAATMLEVVPPDRRRLVTNHEALAYFADRYDFEIVGVVIPGGSTLAAPSSSELADLVALLDETGIDTIFADTTSPTRLAEAVADDVDREVIVVELHTESLGESGSETGTLAGMLLENARLVAEALTRSGAG